MVFTDSAPSLPCKPYAWVMSRWPVYESKEDEFLRRTKQVDHGLVWAGTLHPPYGYGRMLDRGYAHRYAWERVNGPIPVGMVIDHQPTCPKNCVDIDHLSMFSISDHVALGWQRGEQDGGWRRAERKRTRQDPLTGRFTRDGV
jgi:HNH endonuclease